jgi:hypothetical protein
MGSVSEPARRSVPAVLVALPGLALAVAIAAALAPGLAAPFQFDDWADIAFNPAAKAATFFAELPTTVRPLLKASYALNELLFGPSAFGYHLVNLVLHLVATGLVGLLGRRAAMLTGSSGERALWVGLAVAALWALHPVAAESAIYASGRSAVLSGVLLLAALLASTAARPSVATALGAALLAFLAPLARETALIVPFLLLWWQLTLGPPAPAGEMVRRALPVWLGAGAAAAVILAMPRHRALLGFSLEAREPLDALRANVHALWEMISFWPMPWRISIDPASPLAPGWVTAPTFLKAGALVLAAAAAVWARRRWPIIAFGIGWTLLALAPSNSLLWRVEPVGLRPLYLASLGPALVLAWLLVGGEQRRPRLGAAITGVLCVALAAGSAQRAIVYRSPVTLWEDAVAKAPGKGRAWVMLGGAYLAERRASEAEAAFETALDLAPWLVEAERGLDLARVAAGGQP